MLPLPLCNSAGMITVLIHDYKFRTLTIIIIIIIIIIDNSNNNNKELLIFW